MMSLAQPAAQEADLFGWNLGFAIGVTVVMVVVLLVAPILGLAGRIGKQAPMINEPLEQARRDTAALADLRKTIDHAEVIIAGLQRGRSRLGGG